MNNTMNRVISILLVLLMLTSGISAQMSVFAQDTATIAGETSYCGYHTLYQVDITQTKLNYLDTTVTVKNARTILSAGYADVMKVSVQMYSQQKLVRAKTESFNLSEIKNKPAAMTMPSFGKYIVYAEFYKDDTLVYKTDEATVGIAATEYNICPVNASFPVVYLTLSLWDITKTEDGTPVPTFVMLNRTAQYDWDELPENVYGQPNLTDAELRKKGSFESKAERMGEFVADLVEISPADAKFNLYINDAFVKLILRILVANGIEESNYTVKLLSDGSGSYANFNNVFNVEDATAKYETMCENWAKAKEYAREHGEINDLKAIMPEYSSSRYAYVAASTSGGNVEWWVARTNGTLVLPNDTTGFVAKASADPQVKIKAMNTMLAGIQEKGEKEVKEFQALFNFNGEMFADAEIQDKPVMLFVGSRATGEDSFEEFAKFVVAYYGDDYVYYYKGHPATPTALYPEKQEQLDRLGIVDVESSIPAELIFFFYPEIFAAGYSSTTFQSVNADKTLCYFNVASNVASPDYLMNANCYMNHVKMTSAENIKDLCDEAKIEAGKYFLCEIKDNENYDIAIWDAEDFTIKFYKLNVETEKYEFVSGRDAMNDQEITVAKEDMEIVAGKNETIVADAKTPLTYETSDPAVATVSAKGKVTANSVGVATITVKASSSIHYKEAEKQITVYVAPGKVSGVKATSNDMKSVTVSWNKKEGVTGYQVYRATSENGKYTNVYTVKGAKNVTFTDKNVKTGTKYFYKVVARKYLIDRYVVGTESAVVSATPSVKKVNLKTVSNVKGQKAEMTWDKLSGVTGYAVYRADSTGKYTRIKTINGSGTVKYTNSYLKTDVKLKMNAKYSYKIRAFVTVDGVNVYGPYSNVKTVTIKK